MSSKVELINSAFPLTELSIDNTVARPNTQCKDSSESPDFENWEDEYDYLDIAPQADIPRDVLIVPTGDAPTPNPLQRVKYNGAVSQPNDGYNNIRRLNNETNTVINLVAPTAEEQEIIENNHTIATVFRYTELYKYGYENRPNIPTFPGAPRTTPVQHHTRELQDILDVATHVYEMHEIDNAHTVESIPESVSATSNLHTLFVFYESVRGTDMALAYTSWLYEQFIRAMMVATGDIYRLSIDRGVFSLQISKTTGLISLSNEDLNFVKGHNYNIFKHLFMLQHIHEDSDHALAYSMLPGNSNGYFMYVTTNMLNFGTYDANTDITAINAAVDFANTYMTYKSNPHLPKHARYTQGLPSDVPPSMAITRLTHILMYNKNFVIPIDCQHHNCGLCLRCNPFALVEAARYIVTQPWSKVSDEIMDSALVSLASSGHIVWGSGTDQFLVEIVCTMINTNTRPSHRVPALAYEALRRVSIASDNICATCCIHAKTSIRSVSDFSQWSVRQVRMFFEKFCLHLPTTEFLGQSASQLKMMISNWVDVRISMVVQIIHQTFIKQTPSTDVETLAFDVNAPNSVLDDPELEDIVKEAKSKGCNPLSLFSSAWTALRKHFVYKGIEKFGGTIAATIYEIIRGAWNLAKSLLAGIEAQLGPCLTRLFIYGFYIYGVNLCSEYSMPAAVVLGIIGSVVAFDDIRNLALETLRYFYLGVPHSDILPQADLLSAASNIFKVILGVTIPACIVGESISILRSFVTLVQAGKSVSSIMDVLVRFITTPYNYIMAIYNYRTSEVYKTVRKVVDGLEQFTTRDIRSVAQAATYLSLIDYLRATRFAYSQCSKQDYVLRIIDDAVYRSLAVADHCRSILEGAEETTPSLAISLYGVPGTGKSTAVNVVASAAYDGLIECPVKLEQTERFKKHTVLSPADITPIRLAQHMDNVRPGIVSVVDDCINTTVTAELTAKYDTLINMISPAQTPLNVADLNQKNKVFYVSEVTILTSNTPLNAAQTHLAERNAPLRRIIVNANLTIGPNLESLYTLTRFYGVDANEGEEVVTLSESNFCYYIKWLARNHENIFRPRFHSKCTKPSNPRSREVVVKTVEDRMCAQIFTTSTGGCYPIHHVGQQFMLPPIMPETGYVPPSLQYCSLLDQASRFKVDNTYNIIDNPEPSHFARIASSISPTILKAAVVTVAAGCMYWLYNQLIKNPTSDNLITPPVPAKQIFVNDTTTELHEQRSRGARGYGSDDVGSADDNPYMEKLKRRYATQGPKENPTVLDKFVAGATATVGAALSVATIAASAVAAAKGVDYLTTPKDIPLEGLYAQKDRTVELLSFDERTRKHMIKLTFVGGQSSHGTAFAMDQHTLLVPLHYLDDWENNTGIMIGSQLHEKRSLTVRMAVESSIVEQPHYCIVLTSMAIPNITNICSDIILNSEVVPEKAEEVRRINALNLSQEDGYLPFGFSVRDCGDVHGVETRLPGDNGMCGSIYSLVVSGVPKIVGFHTHGTGRGAKKPISIITPLLLDNIMVSIDRARGKIPKLDNVLVINGDHIPRSHRKNEIVPTPLYGTLAPSSRHPIDLGSPIVSEVSLNTIGNALGAVPSTTLKLAVAHTKAQLGVVTGSTLTLCEAINGHGAYGIKAMDLSTSAGLGFGGPKKDFVVGEPGRYRLSPEIEQEYFFYEDQPSDPRVGMAMKAELRSEAKIAAHKARVFCYPDLFYTIFGRKLTAHLFANIAKDPVRQEISVGINPHSSDWGELANVFEGMFVIDGDMSSFDNTIPINVMSAAFDIIKSRCPYMTDAQLAILKSTTIYPTIEYSDITIKKIGGNTSGGVATTGVNSLCTLLLLKSAVLDIGLKQGITLDLNAFRFRANGDDSLMGVPPEFKEIVTPAAVGAVLASYKCTFTSADKSPLLETTDKTIVKCTYLKRNFVRDGDKFNWSAPLPIEVITDIPNYFDKYPASVEEARDIVTSMYNSVAIELVHHGEDEFYKHINLLGRAIEDTYSVTLIRPDYKQLKSHMRHVGIHPQSLLLEDQQDPVLAEDSTTESYATSEVVLRYNGGPQPILERSFKVLTAQISSNTTESIAVLDIAGIIRSNTYLMSVFNRFGTTKFKIRFTCTASINSTLSAMLRFTYLPGVVPTPDYNRTFANTYSEESYIFNIADRQLVFEIEPKTNLDNSWFMQSSSFSLGYLLVSLENGLAGSSVGTEKVQLSVYAELFDVIVSMPVAQMDKETAVKSETRVASKLITGAAGFIEQIPVPGASTVAKVGKVIGSVMSSLGFQCPVDASKATKVVAVAFDGCSNSRGLFSGQNYNCSNSKTILNDPKLAMTTERPDLKEIIAQPGLIKSGSFNNSTTKIFSLQMCPQAQRFDLSGLYAPTKVHYISRFAGSYYGDMNCQILFNCSPMVSCEVLLVHTIGDPGVSDYLSNPDASISERFFIQGPTEVSVRIPYVGNRSRASTHECANGFLTAYLITAPVAATTAIDTQVNYTVYTGAADNFILSEATDFSALFPQSIKPLAVRSGNFIQNFLSSKFVYLREATTYNPTLHEGEMLESYQDIFLRPEAPKTAVFNNNLLTLVTGNPFSKLFLRHRNGFRVTAWFQEGSTTIYTVELVVLGTTRGRVLWNSNTTPVLALNISRPLVTVFDVAANNYPVDPWQIASPVHLRFDPPVTGTLKVIITYSDDTSLGGFVYPSSLKV